MISTFIRQSTARPQPGHAPARVVLRDDVIEFVITGDVPIVVVVVDHEVAGILQTTRTTAVPPFTQTITLGPGPNRVYLSLDVRGATAGALHAAILVNGIIFREAARSIFDAPVIALNGMYVREPEP